MTNEADASHDISRRGVFKQMGAAGVAAIAGTQFAASGSAQDNAAPPVAATVPQREALEALTAAIVAASPAHNPQPRRRMRASVAVAK